MEDIKEQWRDIENFEGLYKISDLGRVYSTRRKKLVKTYIEKKNGYWRVTLHKNSCYKSLWLHRIIATAFISNPENMPQVNHKDGYKLNNHLDNLEWCTASFNSLHAYKIGTHIVSEKFLKKMTKLSKKDISIIKKIGYHEYGDLVKLGKRFGVTSKRIGQIIRNYKQECLKF